ncbi:MAG: alpha-L-fucosidase [bacterium]|nr:alpha-L-fucosidase [bacterium]
MRVLAKPSHEPRQGAGAADDARPPPGSEELQQSLPAWYSDAKLGVFVHWGPYSVPGWAPPSADIQEIFARRGPRHYFVHNPYAEWYVNTMQIPGSPTWRHHRETWGAQLPYEGFGERFEAAAQGFDPHVWTRLFARVHARYVVFTAKHMDGYTLWPSAHPNPRRPGWGARRDLVGEVAAAARGAGLRMGLYYCGGFDTTFEQRVIRTLGDCVLAIPQTAEYAQYAEAHVRELVERYQPDVLWGDVGFPARSDVGAMLSEYHAAVPDGVANDRWAQFRLPPPGTWRQRLAAAALHHADAAWPILPRSRRRFEFPPSPHGDVRTPEYTSPAVPTEYAWELARGLGRSFGYNACEGEAETLTSAALVHLLVDVVSKNGNLLLGVGPQADGSIPPIQRERLESLGSWLDVHGEAVFGTRPWRRAEAETGDGRPVRFTCRDGSVFVTVLAPPRPGELTLPLELAPGARVEQLGEAGAIPWRDADAGAALVVSAQAATAPAHSFRITPEPRLPGRQQ